MRRLVGLVFVIFAAEQGIAGPLQNRPQRSTGPFLTIPASPADLLATLQRLAVVNRQPMGIEAVMGGPVRDRQPIQAAGRFALDISGLPLAAAIEKIVQQRILGPVGEYEWDYTGGVVHVRAAVFRNNRSVVLNKRLPLVAVQARGPRDALHRIHRLLDPSVPSEGEPAPPPPRAPAAVKPFLEKPIVVSLSQATARQVLDEAAISHGSVLWVAQYQDVGGTVQGLKLSFVGFDKWSVSLTMGATRRGPGE
jgi:hypothetical protein